MCLAHIDGQKISMILVIVEDLYNVADLATEGRSSEAAEDQDQRFAVGALAKVKSFAAIERE